MIIDEKKLKIQLEFKSKWEKNNHVGIFELPTGGGKTYAAILCMLDFQELPKLIVVPTIYLKDQWEEELTKHKVFNWKVLVINTAIKNEHIAGILVLDEIHRFASTEFSNIIDLVSFTNGKKVIGLTATLERNDKRHYVIEKYCPTVLKVSVKEALALKLIPEYIIYNLPVNMTEKEEKDYQIIDKGFHKFFGFFDHDFTLAMNCLKSPASRVALAMGSGFPEREILINAVNFVRYMRRRKEFLYSVESKNKILAKIIEKFKDKKIITFAETINTADILAKHIPNSKAYHSKLKKRIKDSTIEGYKNNKFLVMHTARALDEGMDIPDIDIGIIHSSTSTKRQTIQRVGRLLRHNGDNIPMIINLYVAGRTDTQDKKWLINRIQGIPNVYWIDSINEINYDTRNKVKESTRRTLITERILL